MKPLTNSTLGRCPLDFTKPLQTRDGREVRIYSTDGMEPYPIHGALLSELGWVVHTWASSGVAVLGNSGGSVDLVQVPVKHTFVKWVAFWENGEATIYSENPVGKIVNRFIVAIKRVEGTYTEGEGL